VKAEPVAAGRKVALMAAFGAERKLLFKASCFRFCPSAVVQLGAEQDWISGTWSFAVSRRGRLGGWSERALRRSLLA